MTRGQRAQGSVFDAGLLAVPGLEALREIHAGTSPQPPIHYWSGRRLVALQHGEVSIAMPASGWFCGPKARLHPGIFAFLLDMTHLYAVVSTLPAGGGCTTAELSVTVLGGRLPAAQRSRRAAGSSTPTSATPWPKGWWSTREGIRLPTALRGTFCLHPVLSSRRALAANRCPERGHRRLVPCCENPRRRSSRSAPRNSSS